MEATILNENTIWKQSELLRAAQKREREMQAKIRELENDIHWYKIALAEAMRENRRIVLHDIPDAEPEFESEFNIGGEPIVILKGAQV